MQYLAMDNNLEGQIFGDLIEISAAGSTEDVNIVAQVDRSEGYEGRFGDWTDTRRFLLPHTEQPVLSDEDKLIEVAALFLATDMNELDTLREEVRAIYEENPEEIRELLLSGGIDPDDTALIQQIMNNYGLGREFEIEPVEILGEVDMGTSEALADFILWSVENFPAEKYALVISSHGAGWMGNGPDEGNDNTQLTMPEIDEALTWVREQTGIDQFELIGFDACLMGQLEVYATLAPHTRYVVAAEEVVPGQGWEYTVPLTALTEDPSMDGEAFGRLIVDAYRDYYAGPGARTGVDLHLINPDASEDVIAALNEFVAVAEGEILDGLSAFGLARINSQAFGTEVVDVLQSLANADYYATIDLVHLMSLLAAQSTLSDEARAAAQMVADLVPEMVVYSHHDPELPNANGVAVYFPRTRYFAELSAQNPDEIPPYTQSVPSMENWANFLLAWYETIETQLSADDLSITITEALPGEDANVYDPPVVVFDANGQGISNIVFMATLLLDDDSRIMLDYSPIVLESILADGTVVQEYPTGLTEGMQFQWNVEMPVISDGTTTIPALLLFAPGRGASSGYVAGVYTSQTGETSPASLIFDTETRTALKLYGTAEGGAPFEVTPAPGDTFTPYWSMIDAEGNFVYAPAGEYLTFGAEPFTFTYAPAESGIYELSLLIEDYAGNTQISTSLVSIDNEGLDTTLRGFKVLNWGVNFLYPWGWSDPSIIAGENEDEIAQIAVTDPAGEILIFVSATETDAETAITAARDLIESLDDAEVSEVYNLSEIEGFGDLAFDGQAFDYAYSRDGEPRIGTMFVVTAPETGLTYTFDLDTTDARFDESVEVFVTLVNSLTFFEPVITG